MSDDHSWFSERTKTIMVTVVMTILIGGMGWGYIAAQQWKAERAEEALQQQEPIAPKPGP